MFTMRNFSLYLKYLLSRSSIIISNKSYCSIAHSVKLHNVRIFVAPGAHLEIGENVKINNSIVCVEKGSCVISENSIIGNSQNQQTRIIINDGSLFLGDHSKLSLYRIWIRFGGQCTIGCYTNINENSELRCDERISIGRYTGISYNVRIWDTNTHTLLNKQERRERRKKYFPYFGYETSKPKTAPVVIGNDCWIGEKASILKGSKLGNEVIVGYNCLLTGQEIPDKSTVVSQSILSVKSRP